MIFRSLDNWTALNMRRALGRLVRLRGAASGWLGAAAMFAALLIAAPLVSIALSVLTDAGEGARYLSSRVLNRYIVNTLALAGMVAVGVAVIGVATAWLVTMTRFPGRRLFEVLLVLPLAFPAFVVAYAYTDLLDHSGAVQYWLRAATGWGPRDYWFPEVRSLPGAAAMLILVLYPYVYLLARSAFLNQTAAALDVARTLGAGRWSAFFRVALPMARPAIVTGVALALMETVADLGVVSHFGVQTFATAIDKAYFSLDQKPLVGQLAGWLLLFVLALVALERAQRGAARVSDVRAGFQAPPLEPLRGLAAIGAVLICALPLLFGFVIPLGMLGWMSIVDGHAFFGARYFGFALNSLMLAGMAAAATLILAILIAYAVRLSTGPGPKVAALVASMGYAVPGGVVAIGLTIPFGLFDNAINSWAKAEFGVATGLILSSSIFAIVAACVIRFMSVALQTVDAALGKVTPSMDQAARALGEAPAGALRRVHVPMISGGALTAALIVSVDVLKELPATRILRPPGFETLATQAYRLAQDARLFEASTPSLTIALLGLLPVILLSWQIGRSRPGAADRGE